MPDRTEAYAVAGLLFLYLLVSGSHDLSFYDSAELALVAVQGGVGHPIGQPLHTLLGHLLSVALPNGVKLQAVILLSSLPAALCAIPVLSLSRRSTPGTGRSWLRALAVWVGLMHVVFWETATRVEVYTLAAFPALWAVAAWSELADAATQVRTRDYLAPGIALGLSACANPYMAVIAALAGGPFLLRPLLRRGEFGRALTATVVGGLLGLLPYLYVPLADLRSGLFTWGSDDLWRYFRGADYAHNRHPGAEGLDVKFARLADWSLRRGVPFLWLGGLWGGGRRLALMGAIAWVVTLALQMSNSVYLPEITDYFGYLTVPVALSVAGIAALASQPSPRLAGAAVLTAFLATAVALPAPWTRTRSEDHAARDLATAVLNAAPEHAVILAGADHFVFPLHYLQTVEHLRPDVLVLADGLADSSWYWTWIFDTHPDLVRTELSGSHSDRLRRFLAAQGDRPVLVETGPQSAVLGGPVCADAYFARLGQCPDNVDLDAAAQLLERLSAQMGDGSPTTEGVLAQVAFDRGELLWTLGHGRAALRAYLSAVPADVRPPVPDALGAQLEGAPPLRTPPLVWKQAEPLGRAERNLYRAAQLLYAAGLEGAATSALQAAADLGLPEATAP